MAGASLASVQDLAEFWRDMDAAEEKRAAKIIEFASDFLRQIAKNNGEDLDEKIKNNELFASSVALVVLSAAKRAMLTPQDMPPVDQWGQSASPYSETLHFTNPASDLFFKKSELSLIGYRTITGKSQIGILRGVR